MKVLVINFMTDKGKKNTWLRYAALGSSIATTLAGLAGGGFFLGKYLDDRWGTDPIFKIGLIIIGVFLGISYMIVTLNKLGKMDDDG